SIVPGQGLRHLGPRPSPALRGGGRSEPGAQRIGEPQLRSVSDPGYVSIRPNEHGGRSRDWAERGELPWTRVCRVDHLDPICPRSDLEAAGLTKVEEHRAGTVQQGEDPQRAVAGDHLEIRHAAAEQRVSVAEVVVDVQA